MEKQRIIPSKKEFLMASASIGILALLYFGGLKHAEQNEIVGMLEEPPIVGVMPVPDINLNPTSAYFYPRMIPNKPMCGPNNNGRFPEDQKKSFKDELLNKQWFDSDGGEYFMGSYFNELTGCYDWAARYRLLLDKIREIKTETLSQSPQPLIFILDTGVNPAHPDLVNIIDTENSESFVKGAPDYSDDNGHGTHVTGIAGAETDNDEGIASLLPGGIRVVSFKVLNKNGYLSFSSLQRALRKILEIQNENPLIRPIVSMSFGTIYSSYPEGTDISHGVSELMKEIVENRGVLIAAAGNLNLYLDPDEQTWPASSRFVEGVSGPLIEYDEEKHVYHPVMESFNMGRYSLGGASFGYNGFLIMSTDANGHGYTRKIGTSMSAPGYASIVAGLMSAFPELAYDDIRQALWLTGIPIEGSKGRLIDPLGALVYLIENSSDPAVNQVLNSDYESAPSTHAAEYSTYLPYILN